MTHIAEAASAPSRAARNPADDDTGGHHYGRPTPRAAFLGPAASRPGGAVVATIALRA